VSQAVPASSDENISGYVRALSSGYVRL